MGEIELGDLVEHRQKERDGVGNVAASRTYGLPFVHFFTDCGKFTGVKVERVDQEPPSSETRRK